MEEFTRELLHTANRLLARPPVDRNNSARIQRPPAETTNHQVNPADEPAPMSSSDIQQRRRRNQHRHQQRRARRYRHHRPEDASKMQRLYGRYPRKALRKVLGEDSPFYSGGRDRLVDFVAATYHNHTVTPAEVAEARRLYNNCNWEQPSQEEMELLQSPPSADEILRRLKKTVNTSPGMDKIEWRHLKAIDRTGSLLQTVLSAVHTWGIPSSWRRSKTVLIHKKGSTDDPSNFRPISLLSSLYKLYSGVLAQRLTRIATTHGWLSAEQKGFLPGVRGIQEHTFLLQTAIDEAKKRQGDLTIAWMDLTNAFGSIPHPVLGQLFQSLPIPDAVRQKLTDIYTDNQWEFVCEQGNVEAHPVTGAGPLPSLTFRGGMVFPASELRIQQGAIRALEEDDMEVYLGIPTGAKLLYRPATDLPNKMDRLQESLLAPWQKLEALRSQLLPSLSHHLASGRVKKDLLRELDDKTRHLLRNVARVPVSTSRAFFHAERRIGGMAVTPLIEDADIWTVARATQLLSSEDDVVAQIAWSQLRDTITSGLSHHLNPDDDTPVDAFLSGDQSGGLYSFRHHSTRSNLWTRARQAASRLHCRIDASSEQPCITAEDVSTVPAKAVKSLRLVSRERWTAKFLEAPVHGRVARGLDLDKKSKDVTHLLSWTWTRSRRTSRTSCPPGPASPSQHGATGPSYA
ncbi:hypothetical protein EGW08_022750 [Elysia chlorotica]|uniref:Reverse transcriptase domain-containing protein n=1 Tax=Elysia chlorotica TaxID=188477 RepID=A0A3S1AQU2_ELYCH|nr:hypothetical protein EGW08_022750 [Elysia chlorotica]